MFHEDIDLLVAFVVVLVIAGAFIVGVTASIMFFHSWIYGAC